MKVLISPGNGAGWSTWQDGSENPGDKSTASYKALTYKPFIDAIEGGTFEAEYDNLVAQALKDLGASTYFGGAAELEVREIDEPFYVHEYDGDESIRTAAYLSIIPE
jgi:hypothetical protein